MYYIYTGSLQVYYTCIRLFLLKIVTDYILVMKINIMIKHELNSGLSTGLNTRLSLVLLQLEGSLVNGIQNLVAILECRFK